MTPDVSVVITTGGRCELLARALAAVLAQRFDADDCEVIVVDAAGSDETREVVEALAPQSGAPAVRYLCCDRESGMFGARNLGWRAARGALIAFVDDAALLAEPFAADWLATGARALREDARATGARPSTARPRESDFAMLTRCLRAAESGAGNPFIRRDVLERVGGFDERLTRI